MADLSANSVGNFDSLKSLDDQSRLVSQYKRSLDENTGRSCWKYILMDFDNDGIKEDGIILNHTTVLQ